MGDKTRHLTGLSAEARAERHYAEQGYEVERRRWRGPAGEIDLILRRGAELIFVEVKASADFATAAARVTARQIDRICASAAAYLAGEPAGLDSPVRFDVALVDGAGRLDCIENAFGV